MAANVVDGILVAVVVAALLYGWKNGLLRTLVAITAAMFAFVAAKQLYEPVGVVFSEAAGLRPPTFFEGLAYLFVIFLAAGVWFVAIRRLYPHTYLVDPETGGAAWRSVDRVGGLVLGALLGLILAIGTVGIMELLVFYRWPAFLPTGVRDVIHVAFRDAVLVRALFSEAPGLAAAIGHWVPGIVIAMEGRTLP
jgi:uncharacterized membrane protein required for colicin V production